MGRIKTKMTKRLSLTIYNEYKDKVTSEFEGNKQVVREVLPDASKKIRNTVAGYVTRIVKSHKD